MNILCSVAQLPVLMSLIPRPHLLQALEAVRSTLLRHGPTLRAAFAYYTCKSIDAMPLGTPPRRAITFQAYSQFVRDAALSSEGSKFIKWVVWVSFN